MTPEAVRKPPAPDYETRIINAISTLLLTEPQRTTNPIDLRRSFMDERPEAPLRHFRDSRPAFTYTLHDPNNPSNVTEITFLLDILNIEHRRKQTVDEGWVGVRLSSDNPRKLPKTMKELVDWLKNHTPLKDKIVEIPCSEPFTPDDRGTDFMIIDLTKITNPESVTLIFSSPLPRAPILKGCPDFLLQCSVAFFQHQPSETHQTPSIGIPSKEPIPRLKTPVS